MTVTPEEIEVLTSNMTAEQLAHVGSSSLSRSCATSPPSRRTRRWPPSRLRPKRRVARLRLGQGRGRHSPDYRAGLDPGQVVPAMTNVAYVDPR